MIREDKVIIMSKLAMLEKKGIKKDIKITNYYPEDYIYMNNLMTRISIFCMIAVGVVIHILLKLEKDIVIPSTSKELFIYYILPYGVITLVIMGIYTVISTSVYTKRYKEAEERVENYKLLMRQLEELDKIEEEEERRRGNGKRKTLNPAS